jgi:KipI family sensor histidine kinase inhibitor
MNEHSLLINIENAGNETLRWRTAAAQALKNHYGNKVIINQGAASLLALWPMQIISQKEITEVVQLLENVAIENAAPGTQWRLPIFYDRTATDLLAVATQLNLDVEEVIALHKNAAYTVSFIGFLPGFPYLIGLPDILAIPRKHKPAAKVAKGAVAIAVGLCGMYPQASPGGWYVLGNCPVPLFDKEREQSFLLRSMDTIHFYEITEKSWKALIKENKFTHINTYKHG